MEPDMQVKKRTDRLVSTVSCFHTMCWQLCIQGECIGNLIPMHPTATESDMWLSMIRKVRRLNKTIITVGRLLLSFCAAAGCATAASSMAVLFRAITASCVV